MKLVQSGSTKGALLDEEIQLPPNLKRTASGFVFRKVIPKHLRQIVGKTEIKVACGKSYAEAIGNYHTESLRAQQLLNDASEKLAASDSEFAASRARYISPATHLKPISHVTPELVEQLRGLWLAGLEHDLNERAQGLTDERYDEIAANILEMQSTLAKASARGRVEVILPALHQLLYLRGYVLALRPDEERRLAYDFLDAVMQGYEILKARHDGLRLQSPEIHDVLPEFVPPGVGERNTRFESGADVLTVGKVVEDFLENYAKKPKGKEMLKKHRVALPLLSEMVGSKLPVANLRQVQINRYFEQIQRLPARWPDICRRNKINVIELLKNDVLLGPIGMSPKTFNDSYRASISGFLRMAKKDFQDQGFPVTLTTDGIEYTGTRREGENAQRAMNTSELKRLFEGNEMREFASDPTQAHCYWLAHIGLFTGARINEICQVNPQTDIHKDSQSGVIYIRITDETPAADNILKSAKNSVSKRSVPFHPVLIELGIADYVEALQRAGAKQIFPGFLPKKGRASPNAETWFRRLIASTGLRDETPGARLAGYHAFRSTLLAAGQEFEVDLTPITGHAGTLIADMSDGGPGVKKTADQVVRKYQGEMSISRKLKRLERVTFPIKFISAVKPSIEDIVHQVVCS